MGFGEQDYCQLVETLKDAQCSDQPTPVKVPIFAHMLQSYENPHRPSELRCGLRPISKNSLLEDS